MSDGAGDFAGAETSVGTAICVGAALIVGVAATEISGELDVPVETVLLKSFDPRKYATTSTVKTGTVTIDLPEYFLTYLMYL